MGTDRSSPSTFADVANFGSVRALQGVVLAFIVVGSLAYLYFLAAPVSLLVAMLLCC